MAIALNITLADLATPALVRLGNGVRGPEIRAAMGGALRRELRNHLRGLDRKKANKMGGERTNFYGRAAAAVQVPVVTSEGVTVSINHLGLAQRYFGGTIEAKPGGPLLTIPVNPAAYGRRAGEFNDLSFILSGPENSPAAQALLVRKEPGRAFGEVFYVLKRSVEQEPDPDVLPNEAVLVPAIKAAIEAQAKVILARNN